MFFLGNQKLIQEIVMRIDNIHNNRDLWLQGRKMYVIAIKKDLKTQLFKIAY